MFYYLIRNRSFSENLKERGIFVSGAVAAGIDRLHRIRLRAKSQGVIDKVIKELVHFIAFCGFIGKYRSIKKGVARI